MAIDRLLDEEALNGGSAVQRNQVHGLIWEQLWRGKIRVNGILETEANLFYSLMPLIRIIPLFCRGGLDGSPNLRRGEPALVVATK